MNKNYLIAQENLFPILIKSNFHLISEEYHEEAFGSSYSVYSNNELEIRIVWDGKDYCIRIDYKNQQGTNEVLISIYPIDYKKGISKKQIDLLINTLSSFIEKQ